MASIPMLDYYSSQFRLDGADAPTGRKGRIFTAICQCKGTTRKKLAKDMGIRPATVSDLVMELIEDGMVAETRPVKVAQKGRPEIALSPASDRLYAVVCYTVSQTIYCVLLNLAGQPCHEAKREVESDTMTKQEFLELVQVMFEKCVDELPPHAVLCGLSMSLPGIVDEHNGRWVYSAYWPNLSNLHLSELEQMLNCRVACMKNLGCELRARLSRRRPSASGDTILIHWGLGIGAALSKADWTTDSGIDFGEIGHCVVDQQSPAICKCGLTGCVEAEAGLWAIANNAPKNKIPSDEKMFGTFLDVSENRDFLERPITLMAQTLRNLTFSHRPGNIIITGPFVQVPEVFESLLTAYDVALPDNLPIASGRRPTITTGRQSIADERIGAAAVLFKSELAHRLG